jgi:hypothetical protein
MIAAASGETAIFLDISVNFDAKRQLSSFDWRQNSTY